MFISMNLSIFALKFIKLNLPCNFVVTNTFSHCLTSCWMGVTLGQAIFYATCCIFDDHLRFSLAPLPALRDKLHKEYQCNNALRFFNVCYA